MVFYSFEDYKFKSFEKSDTLNKKYDAILINKTTKKQTRVPFGDSRYGQYKDSTGLGLYSSKNTLDNSKKKLYRIRHAKDLRDGFFSPGYFAFKFLW
jgi:hypothetical protein